MKRDFNNDPPYDYVFPRAVFLPEIDLGICPFFVWGKKGLLSISEMERGLDVVEMGHLKLSGNFETTRGEEAEVVTNHGKLTG